MDSWKGASRSDVWNLKNGYYMISYGHPSPPLIAERRLPTFDHRWWTMLDRRKRKARGRELRGYYGPLYDDAWLYDARTHTVVRHMCGPYHSFNAVYVWKIVRIHK